MEQVAAQQQMAETAAQEAALPQPTAEALAAELNHAKGPCQMLIPMGGFSHEDRPGGAIEAAELREIAADVLARMAQAFTVERLPHHINADETAQAAVAALLERMPDA